MESEYDVLTILLPVAGGLRKEIWVVAGCDEGAECSELFRTVLWPETRWATGNGERQPMGTDFSQHCPVPYNHHTHTHIRIQSWPIQRLFTLQQNITLLLKVSIKVSINKYSASTKLSPTFEGVCLWTNDLYCSLDTSSSVRIISWPEEQCWSPNWGILQSILPAASTEFLSFVWPSLPRMIYWSVSTPLTVSHSGKLLAVGHWKVFWCREDILTVILSTFFVVKMFILLQTLKQFRHIILSSKCVLLQRFNHV